MKKLNLTDEELMNQIALSHTLENEQIRKCYRELYKRYYCQAIRLARYNKINLHDSEEAAQDTFLKLLIYRKSYCNGKCFKNWFFKILINEIKATYHKNKKHRYLPIEDQSESSYSDQSSQIEDKDNQIWIYHIINKLPKKYKQVLILKYYKGCSIEDISEIVHLKTKQIYNRLNEAYNRLKKLVEGNSASYPEPEFQEYIDHEDYTSRIA